VPNLAIWEMRDKAPINGVNAVRLYAEMANVTLDQLTIAGGQGFPVLQALDEDARRWRRKARSKGYS
jgi:hypothetical protein